MLLVLFGALFTVAQALVIPKFRGLEIVNILVIALGLSGLVIQIYLIVTKQKEKWLINRFAAERLRSIKFQAYPLVTVAPSTTVLSQLADAFYSKEIARLDMELNSGITALMHFSPTRSIVRTTLNSISASAEISREGQNAYRELRLDYQKRFATSEVDSLRETQRIGYTSGDILYLAGAFLLVGALVSKLLAPNQIATSNWIDFLGVASFIIGMMKAMAANASISEASKVRYEDYVQALDECDQELEREHARFAQVVEKIERIALEELHQFCKSASQISYRL